MRIKAIESATKKPLPHCKIQLQFKGKDAGFLSVTTDEGGLIQLDEKYKGQQVAALMNGIQSTWVTANEGVTIILDTKQTAQVGGKEKHKETWK